MALLSETRAAINNVSRHDELLRRIGTIEAQVVAWLAEANALAAAVDELDKKTIMDMIKDLDDRLTAAKAPK